jgi:RHS repeat-associated protein
MVKKVFDKIGRLARIYLNNVLECSYQYYIDGKLHKTNYLNGISMEYFYYTDGQLQRMLVTKGSNTLYNFNYEYDPAKNLTYKNEVAEKNCKYDELNRLVWEKDGREGSDGAYKNIFKYDSANNRSEQFTDDLALFENQVNTTYSYDDFNRLNTLEDASTIHNFIYNTENYRVQKDDTRYAYEYDKPISEYNQSGEIAFNLFGTKLILREEGNRKIYYVFNSHGDVISLTDENGSEVATYQYNAFGNVINQTGNVDTPFKYAGYVYDSEIGLYYLNARYYDPVVGRFLTEDTYLGNQSDPLSLNLYTYTLNNPLKYYDPTGHLVDGDFLSTEERAGRYTLYNGIQYNYTGSDVIALQKWLINNDWWDKANEKYKAENKGKSLQRPGVNGIAFGYFGSATEYVVNYYKDTAGIENTGDFKGVVGQTTWEHMGISTTLVIDAGGINTNSNDKNIYRDFARALNERYAGDAFIKFLFPVGQSYGLDDTIGQAIETGVNMYSNRGGQVIVDYVVDSLAKNKQYARVILIGHSAGAQGVGDAGKVLTDIGKYVPQIIQIGAPSEPVSNTIVDKTLRVQVATDIVANFVNQSNINKIVGADIAIYGAIKNNNTSMPKTKILDIYVDPKDATGGHSTYFNKGNIYGYHITDSDYYTDGYYNNIWATINSFWDLVK